MSVGVPLIFVFGVALAVRVKLMRNGDLISGALGLAAGFVLAASYSKEVVGFLHGLGELLRSIQA